MYPESPKKCSIGQYYSIRASLLRMRAQIRREETLGEGKTQPERLRALTLPADLKTRISLEGLHIFGKTVPLIAKKNISQHCSIEQFALGVEKYLDQHEARQRIDMVYFGFNGPALGIVDVYDPLMERKIKCLVVSEASLEIRNSDNLANDSEEVSLTRSARFSEGQQSAAFQELKTWLLEREGIILACELKRAAKDLGLMSDGDIENLKIKDSSILTLEPVKYREVLSELTALQNELARERKDQIDFDDFKKRLWDKFGIEISLYELQKVFELYHLEKFSIENTKILFKRDKAIFELVADQVEQTNKPVDIIAFAQSHGIGTVNLRQELWKRRELFVWVGQSHVDLVKNHPELKDIPEVNAKKRSDIYRIVYAILRDSNKMLTPRQVWEIYQEKYLDHGYTWKKSAIMSVLDPKNTTYALYRKELFKYRGEFCGILGQGYKGEAFYGDLTE